MWKGLSMKNFYTLFVFNLVFRFIRPIQQRLKCSCRGAAYTRIFLRFSNFDSSEGCKLSTFVVFYLMCWILCVSCWNRLIVVIDAFLYRAMNSVMIMWYFWHKVKVNWLVLFAYCSKDYHKFELSHWKLLLRSSELKIKPD